MTRPTKAQLERTLKGLRDDKEEKPGLTLIVPDNALTDDDGDLKETTVPKHDVVVETDDGIEEFVISHYHRENEFTSGISVIPESGVCRMWADILSSKELSKREYDLRLEQGDPIPPILEREYES